MKKINVATYLVCDDFETRKNMGYNPVFMTDGAACADMCLCRDLTIPAGKIVKESLNVHFDIPERYKILMYPRSSLAVKYGLMSPVSVIDSDYKGNVHVVLYNTTSEDVHLERGTRVVQIEVSPCGARPVEDWECKSVLRGQNGFGSTGEK